MARFPSAWCFFYLLTTGWIFIFDMSLCENPVNAINIISILLVHVFKKNLNASKPSEHPPQVEECLKV